MHFFYKVQVWGVQRARILIMNHVTSKMKLGYYSKQRWAIFRRLSGIIQPFTLFFFFLFQILPRDSIPCVFDSNAPVDTLFCDQNGLHVRLLGGIITLFSCGFLGYFSGCIWRYEVISMVHCDSFLPPDRGYAPAMGWILPPWREYS